MAQTHSLDLEASSSQYATANDAASMRVDDTWTIEAWIKPESLHNGYILNARSGENGWGLGVLATGKIAVYAGSGAFANTESTSSYVAGTWYHLAVYFNGASTKLYINGKLDATLANAAITNPNTTVYLGRKATSADTYFDGLIKDVRGFNSERTQAQVVSDARTETVSGAQFEWNLNNTYTDSSGNGNTLTASGSPVFSTDRPWVASTQIDGSTYLETNLVSYYTFDESSGNAADSHGANTLTNNNTATYVTGKLDNAVKTETTGSKYLSIADASQSGLDITGDLSMSFWFKGASGAYIVGKHRSADANRGYLVGYGTDGGTGPGLFAYISANGSAATADNDETAIANVSTQFNHIAASYDASEGAVTFFVNGAQTARLTGFPTSIFNNATAFQVGGFGAGQVISDTEVDELAVYSRALHYGDVLDLYNAGNGITYISSTAYSLAVDVGTFTLTGVAALFNKTLSMAADLGTYTLTGVDAILRRGYGFAADVGSYVLTGIDNSFNKTLNMATTVGEFTLTGVATTFAYGRNLVASVGSYILTGFVARMPLFFQAQTRNSVTLTSQDKNSGTFTAQDKSNV